MRCRFASTAEEAQVKNLLSDGGLPWGDITSSGLKHFLILEDESSLIGVIGLEVMDRIALLRSLAIRNGYRNRGYASQLVVKVEEYAQSLGVRALYLLTMTAERFFAGKGYTKLDRNEVPISLQHTSEFRDLCPETAVCMVKYLSIRRELACENPQKNKNSGETQ